VRCITKVKNLEVDISSSSGKKKGSIRIHQGHCNIWLGLVNNIILKTGLVHEVWM
jgi:hypothetical protein